MEDLPPEEDSTSRDEWRNQQLEDPELALLYRWIEESEDPDPGILYLQSAAVKQLWRLKDQLEIRQGILRYKWICPSGAVTRSLIIAPLRRRHDIISAAHANVCLGHPGPEKTIQVIKQRFFWVGMRADVKIYIQSCDLCSRNKKASRNPKAPMRKFHAGNPMERIHIDILGPLTESARQNKYILVMVDQFTKWLELKALPDQSAERVARAFVEEFVCRMGCAQQVFSDQGKNFCGKLFQEMCSLLQTAKARTTPYRPSSNGQVERMNREILNKLRVHIDGHQAIWDQYLPFIGMAIRATVNRSTGFTPNMMMLGREVTLPMDSLTNIPTSQDAPPSEVEYVQQLRSSLQEVHNCARERLGTTLQSRKRSYDRKTKVDTYNIGDLVYILNSAGKTGQSRKLQPLYTGPYLIIKKLSNILFTIVNSRGRQQVIHHDRMRRCSDDNIPIWARRERARIQNTGPEQEVLQQDEDRDWSLPRLFEDRTVEEPDPMTLDDPDPATEDADRDPMLSEDLPPADVTDLPAVSTSPDTANSPTTSRSQELPPSNPDIRLPPSKRSGRQRRYPNWLQDYVTQRAKSNAHH